VTVGLTSDDLAPKTRRADRHVRSFEDRKRDIENELRSYATDYDREFEVRRLDEPTGIATEAQFDAPVVSPETETGGKRINEIAARTRPRPARNRGRLARPRRRRRHHLQYTHRPRRNRRTRYPHAGERRSLATLRRVISRVRTRVVVQAPTSPARRGRRLRAGPSSAAGPSAARRPPRPRRWSGSAVAR